MFRKKKNLSDKLFLHFSFESSESDRVFNYLHDSNSIFRAWGIKSENFFGCTVSGLFSMKLENDHIQDFDLRWEQALILTSDPRGDKVSEGLYVSKLQDSSQAQTIMALFNQENLRGGGLRDYHRLRMCLTKK